jgi:hypothetical protein
VHHPPGARTRLRYNPPVRHAQPVVRPVARWVQVPVFGAVAMLLTLGGHVVGHGDPPAWPALLLVATGSAALRAALGRSVRSVPGMFFAILAAQVLGHLIFLVMTPVAPGQAVVGHHGSILLPTLDATAGPLLGGDVWMWLAHTLAAALVAAWLYRGEALSAALARRVAAVARHVRPQPIPPLLPEVRVWTPSAPVVRGRHTVLLDAPRRGPPGSSRPSVNHAIGAPSRHRGLSSDRTLNPSSIPAGCRRRDSLSRSPLIPRDCSVLNSHGMPPRCDKKGGIPLCGGLGRRLWPVRVLVLCVRKSLGTDPWPPIA